MRIHNDSLVLDGTDMTSNITSNPVWLGHIVNYSIQVVFTGSPNGAFKLQVSNDLGAEGSNVNNPTITNWTNVGDSNIQISSAGDIVYDMQNIGFRWARLVWTDSASASGTITSAVINMKGV